VNYFAPSNPKSIGFNLHYIGNRGYVEFRYPGGDSPTLEKMKSTTLYYAHLIKLAVDKNYKRKEFLKKLVKMMVNLKDIRDRKVNLKETFTGMKKGKLYRIPVDYDENGLYNLVMTTEDLPDELQTLSLFIRRNAAPGVFKGLRKKDGKMFPVFEIIGGDGKMRDKIFSLDDFAFFKKSGSIEGMGKTSTNFKAYNYFRNKMEDQ